MSPGLRAPPCPRYVTRRGLITSYRKGIFRNKRGCVLRGYYGGFEKGSGVIPLFFVPETTRVMQCRVSNALACFRGCRSAVDSLGLVRSALVFVEGV